MSQVNGHAKPVPTSVEDAVRQAIRDPEQRKAFRDKYPSYDAAKLREEIAKADQDIEQFEAAIVKAQRYKRECEDLIRQCDRRDQVLKEMRERNA